MTYREQGKEVEECGYLGSVEMKCRNKNSKNKPVQSDELWSKGSGGGSFLSKKIHTCMQWQFIDGGAVCVCVSTPTFLLPQTAPYS